MTVDPFMHIKCDDEHEYANSNADCVDPNIISMQPLTQESKFKNMDQATPFPIRKEIAASMDWVAKKESLKIKVVTGRATWDPNEETDTMRMLILQRRQNERIMEIRQGAYNRQRYGRQTDQELEELDGKLRRKREHQDLFIYISLEYGKLYGPIEHQGRKMKVMTKEEQHSTVAYLPYTNDTFFTELVKEMPNILQAWKQYESEWPERPTAESGNSGLMMLPMRRAWINSSNEEEAIVHVGRLSEGELERQIEAGTIYLCKASQTRINGIPNQDNWEDGVRKYWKRDRRRLDDMYAIERISRSKMAPRNEAVSVLLSNCSLCAQSQVYSLMHYLREYLIYAKQAYHLEPEDEVAVLSPNRWHVSLPNYTTDDPNEVFVVCMEQPRDIVGGMPPPTRPIETEWEAEATRYMGGASSSQEHLPPSDGNPSQDHQKEEKWEVCD